MSSYEVTIRAILSALALALSESLLLGTSTFKFGIRPIFCDKCSKPDIIKLGTGIWKSWKPFIWSPSKASKPSGPPFIIARIRPLVEYAL